MATKSEKKTAYSIAQYELNGEKAESISMGKDILNEAASPALMAQYVRVYLTNQRQGNASTKTRAEVGGTTKKMYKQKGTGKARHGSYKAPLFKGGGVVGGPKPKIYELSMNKKQRLKVLFAALTLKASQEGIIGMVLSKGKDALKTKMVSQWIHTLKLDGKKTLFVLSVKDIKKYALAMRNLEGVKYTSAHSLNTFDILQGDKIVFVGEAFKELESHFLKKHEN